MIAITVELLHGTIRAASSSDLALTDQGDSGDWPPSPARLFSALVAADGTRDRCRMTDGSELRALESASPPTIFASPRSQVLQTRLNSRFVVVNAKAPGAVQEYPARSAAPMRPGTRLSPKLTSITYVWTDVEATDALVRSLTLRAARIGYFGCSDSPARVRVDTSLPDVDEDLRWDPDVHGTHDVPVPFPGLTGVLDAMFDAFTGTPDEREGQPVRRSWYPVKRARYRSPRDEQRVEESPWADVVWLRVRPPIPGRSLLRATEALKSAVLRLYESHFGAVPRELHGHGFENAVGYQLVHWIGLPEIGYEHARGRLHGFAIAVPRGVDRSVVANLRATISQLHVLTIKGRPSVAVAPHAGQARPWSAQPRRWMSQTRRWVSTSPVIHERRIKGDVTIEHVSLWCRNAGIDTPVKDFRISPVPLVRGALALRPHEVFHSSRGHRPFAHLEVLFERDVQGPVVLGRARQLGIGLMAPVQEP